MLSKQELDEIREHLERAQNPVFYYDNDADGLCSFVLLRRFLGRGKGVAVRSFPDLNESYARKARELNADYVFILDKPVLSREFVAKINEFGLPLVWIDHHDVVSEEFEKEFSNFFVYNPTRKKGKEKSEEPVTYITYNITKRKEDIWLAVIGCIADHFLPDFVEDFVKIYSDYWGKIKEPFDAYYGTEIGKIARALNFGLKDSITNVIKLQNFLINVRNPSEIFSECSANVSFRKKYEEIKEKYGILLQKAKLQKEDRMIFFDYGGDLSISSDIANELSYEFPRKYIAVAYKKNDITNLSLRGKNVKAILANVLKKIEGRGGGHEDAVGARINTNDLEKFKEIFEEEISVK